MLCLSGPWSLTRHAHVAAGTICSCAESCSSVMLRWVASSGHVADDHGFDQEAEMLQWLIESLYDEGDALLRLPTDEGDTLL